jgi:signal transduction histidine kinase
MIQQTNPQTNLRTDRQTGGRQTPPSLQSESNPVEPRTWANRVLAPVAAESLAPLLHDTRNMVAAMDLYCDLLDEPGVLSDPYRHYVGELRQVSEASRRLMARLTVLDAVRNDTVRNDANSDAPGALGGDRTGLAEQDYAGTVQSWNPASHPASGSVLPPPSANRIGRSPAPAYQGGKPIASLAPELEANLPLLSALSGPGITVGLTLSGGRRPIPMSGEDLTRVLVNLTTNATDAMPGGGHIQISLTEEPDHLALTFTDSGCGFPESALETVFTSGYSTHVSLNTGSDAAFDGWRNTSNGAWPAQHRGLGLAIVRSIVAAAGGLVYAANRTPVEDDPAGQPFPAAAFSGAVIAIEFPLSESVSLDTINGNTLEISAPANPAQAKLSQAKPFQAKPATSLAATPASTSAKCSRA